jgi:bifunctional DNA-binding transcriptional regulator/antitoxin component of YhaV-PrlF toxin-antitoxin module
MVRNMEIAKITSKGQITISQEIREKMSLKKSDKKSPPQGAGYFKIFV